jgi:hypothetical protein
MSTQYHQVEKAVHTVIGKPLAYVAYRSLVAGSWAYQLVLGLAARLRRAWSAFRRTDAHC